MSALADLSLLRPLWLLALPLLVLAFLALRRRQTGLGDWGRVIDPELLAALRDLGRIEGQGAGAAGLTGLTAAGLIALALTGPATERRDAAAFRNLDGVVFVMDASLSTTEGEDWPALLTMGRFGVAALGSRPAALVVYAGDAYVATDMTADTPQLGLTMSLIDAETVPDKGSRPALGLALARQLLDEAGILAGDVILLSDGGGLGPEALAEAAGIAQGGARLSVVTGSSDATLDTLVSVGEGRRFALSDTDAFAAFLDDSARERLERQDFPLLFRADHGRWLLILALIPVLLLFRRRAGA